MNLVEKLRVEPNGTFRLKDHVPDDTFGMKKAQAQKILQDQRERLADLQLLLYAERKHALLIVLQGMDASGKDGTIRHVMSGVNPQGCSVTSFKEPTPRELSHDFLWRIHAAVPARGDIGIFNRSHYEDVLVARVHNLVPKSVWADRYEQINGFEKMLAMNNTQILKFFLHISSAEQEKRFHERFTDPRKNWKASPADLRERQYWDDYQQAYEDAISKCTTKWASWYRIPADHKWFRNFAVADIIIKTLESLKMQFPKADKELLQQIELTHQGGKRAASA